MQNSNWTSVWPTDPGNYWYQGWLHRTGYKAKPKTYFVKVHLLLNKSLMYATEGGLFYNNEGAKGLWLPAEVPEPSEFNLEELQ